MLADDGCRGVARSGDGRFAVFAHSGVADLFALVTDNPSFLDGASVADRVIGRGAALLLVLGRVAHVYARVISTGVCPVEQLTAGTDLPEEAYALIKQFIEEHATPRQ